MTDETNVAYLPGARPLNTPEKPPRSWFRDNPDWYVEGQTLEAKLDGPDEGRVVGLIQPPPNMSKYLSTRAHPNYGITTPDARRYPDGFRTFNRGPLVVVNDDGTEGKVQVGRIPIRGPHSTSAGARSITEAVQHTSREGRWAGQADDIKLIGTASAVESGPYAGAVMFRGMMAPGSTVADAMEVNTTTVSGENWPDPTFNGQLVLAGVVRVDHTAFPYDVPSVLAASTDGADMVMVGWENTPVPASPIPIEASEDHDTIEIDLKDLEARMTAAEQKLGDVEHDLAETVISLEGVPGVESDNKVASLETMINDLMAKIEDLEAQIGSQPSGSAEPVDPNAQPIPAGR